MSEVKRRSRLLRTAVSAATAFIVATGSVMAATPAAAATVYEITGDWEAGTPTTVGRGDVVNAIWRVNVNDDQPAPANEPVENVTFTATTVNGAFRGLPNVCLTAGVSPASSISQDGSTLTCNLGTVAQGTAVVVQTPIVVDGETGDQVVATGEIDGQQRPLPPIDIQNAFAMDLQFGQNTAYYKWNPDYTSVDVGLEWSLRLGAGSDVGPDSVTYRLQLADSNGASIGLGEGFYGDVGCSPFNAYIAAGHPWSGMPDGVRENYPANQQTSHVDTCALVPVAGQPGAFDLTLTGINYDMATVPTRDSAGNPLPTDWSYIASGSLWFRVATTQAGSISLQSNAPAYQSTTGLTSVDLTENNTTNKSYVLPGLWASPWWRPYTGAGGNNWDDTYRVSAGTKVVQYINHNASLYAVPDDTLHGQCLVFDTDYVTYTPWAVGDALPTIRGYTDNGPAGELNNPPAVEYYVGNVGDPDLFNCGSDPANWTTAEPADRTAVQAIRIIYPHSLLEDEGHAGIQLAGYSIIRDDVRVGQDIWMFGSVMSGGVWSGQGESSVLTPTPGARYPHTNFRRDILRTITATPSIAKSVDRSVVKPGEPASFTLTYSANGAGAIPETMDGYVITDTLPVGMSYVAGSADPAPVVSTNGSGQQVLTWTLDDVPTNVRNILTYQAVAGDSVTPGQVLTNTAQSAVGGQTSTPASAQVTVSTSGTTMLGKTTDQWFIANPDGDGSGETGSWTVTLRSQDPLPQAFTDTIDILPFNGDGRGTDFSGTYALTSVQVPAGSTVYYTDAVPSTLSDDPNAPANGTAGSPSAMWTTDRPESPTAIRVVGGELPAGETRSFVVTIQPDGAEPGDVYVNRAQAIAEHTELVMRTSEPLTMGSMYSVSLKKYVQDIDGNWVDANDAVEYPTYRVGETVPYRVVVTNTGQGTLRDLVITDDQQPELGGFTIDELEPGAESAYVHEYDVVLEAGGPDTLINWACVNAPQPADTEEQVQESCDPAGIQVTGDPAHSKTLVSATPIGDGQWELLYDIEVTNESGHPTSYDLDDTLRFTDEATIVSAEVTGAPADVTLATPAWNGQDEVRIASGVPLAGNDDAGYAPHHYAVRVVAEVPLFLPGAGTADDPTQCGADDDDSARAFSNTTTLTDARGDTEQDRACAPIPSIEIDKGVSAGPTPNGDGTWTVVYDIVATNAGDADGVYEVTDMMTADGDLVVESGRVITTPDGVTASADWTGLGAEQTSPENVIASDVTLPAGGTHTYQVEVVVSVDAEGLAPVITGCDATGESDGGLSNTAELEHNDLTDSAEACITLAWITVDKTVAAGPTPNGDGTWTVEYEIVAENVGAAAGDYDVYDQLRFGPGIAIESTDITAPDGVAVDEAWTGLGAAADADENRIAAGVSLGAGERHSYTVAVVVSMDEETIDPSALACPAPGSGEPGGLANGTLLDHNGIEAIDAVCPTLPLIDVDKSIADGPTGNGDGTWTVTYDLVATNRGAAEGEYDIADELRFGEGVVIESAELVSAPEGVAVGDAWDGRGEDTIATDVALAAGGSHTYRVQAVVSLDLDVVTPDALGCTPGAAGGLANTVDLTHNGETRSDAACAALPLIETAKSLSGAVVPVDGEEGVYDATYEITVTNRGPGAGEYDLDDRLAVGEGVTVMGVRDVSTDAADSVGLNPGFGTDGDERIVTDQPIAAAVGAPVVHTYAVTIRYALDLDAVDVPVAESCIAGDGVAPGAVHNVAAVSWNGIGGEDDACILPSKPTLDKQLVSAEPAGDGQWTVTYDLIVGNAGTEATVYDLDDEFLFAPDVTVDTVTVLGPEGVEVDGGFDGAGSQRIATDVEIPGLDDEGYAPHVYTVTVLVDVPLHFDAAEADGTGAPGCTAPAGANALRQGLNNAATLTDETGGTQTDTDCAPLPSIAIAKSIVGEPELAEDGTWTVTYEIVASNDGAEAGDYTLTDQLRYGAGITVTGATVTESPEGVTLLEGWTGLGEDGAAENVVAEGVLAAGAAHTYRVAVTSTLDTDAADASTLACPEPGSDAAGGFANTAGIAHNGLTDAAAACALPEWPQEVPPPTLPDTGASIGVGVGVLALLLMAAGALLVARRRSEAATQA